MSQLKIIIDKEIIEKYEKYYFEKYPRRKKSPIKKPIPPSLNQWMVMKRFQMNHLKQIWKEFIEWLVKENGLENKKIPPCDIVIKYEFPDKRRRDCDNYFPKNILDGMVSSGLLVDDSLFYVKSIMITGKYSKEKEARTIIEMSYE